MRILHVVDSLNIATGGPARSVTRLADTQARLGETVTVVANDYRELGLSQPLEAARSVRLPARRLPFRFGAWSPQLRSALETEVRQAEIVHLHGIWLPTNHLAARLAGKFGRPYLVSPRGMLEDWAWRHRAVRKQFVWRLIERRLLLRSHGIHATSEAEAAAIRRRLPESRVILAPNGIDLPASSPPPRPIGDFFPRLAGRRILLFLSRLHPKKGVSELLEAWRRLAFGHPEWILALAGDDFDGHRQRFEKACAAAGLTERTVFTGEVHGEAKAALLAASELFILPSHSENFGLVIGEALAAGLPVITTTATPWEILRTQGCGWWIPLAALEPTMAEALGHSPESLRARGARGPALVKTNFNWEASSRILIQACRAALPS